MKYHSKWVTLLPAHGAGISSHRAMRFSFSEGLSKKLKGYCEKYRQSLRGPHIACPHPKEYCKFRSACIVHFMGKNVVEEKQGKTAACGKEREREDASGEKANDEGTGI